VNGITAFGGNAIGIIADSRDRAGAPLVRREAAKVGVFGFYSRRCRAKKWLNHAVFADLAHPLAFLRRQRPEVRMEVIEPNGTEATLVQGTRKP
jgi:hypothetical protein